VSLLSKGAKSSSSNVTYAIDYLEVPALLTFALRDTYRPGAPCSHGTGLRFQASDTVRRYLYAIQRGFNQFVHDTEFGWLAEPASTSAYEWKHDDRGPLHLRVTPVFDADPRDSDADDRNSVFAVVLGTDSERDQTVSDNRVRSWSRANSALEPTAHCDESGTALRLSAGR